MKFKHYNKADDELVCAITQPHEGSLNLFKHPKAAPANPWNYANSGGSAAHKSFVFTRLYRTFAQFKKNPSGKLNVNIIAADRAEFKEHHSSRVYAAAVYAEYELAVPDPLKPLKLQTHPFRVICMQNHITYGGAAGGETFASNFIANIPKFGDKTGMQTGLIDTTNQAVAAADWDLKRMPSVQRHMTKKGIAGVGLYPFTESGHPKYEPFVHNAIGNLFEIVSWDRTSNVNLILKDIYWEDLPGVMLCFNNYGVDAAHSQAPRAFYLQSYAGVTGFMVRDASAPNDQTSPTSRVQDGDWVHPSEHADTVRELFRTRGRRKNGGPTHPAKL